MSVPPIEADGYRYYGKWAGNPKGNRQVKSRCVAEVRGREMWLTYQCNRNRSCGPNADYCKQHAKKVS